jgi:DNA-binding LacI/PurR family transcriptional regulator
MEERPITIRQLAKLLQISDATVSMALRNNPKISAPTRERVRALAKKLNYRGNILVNALLTQVRRGRVNNFSEGIALLLEGTEPHKSASLIEGEKVARQRANLAGLKLEVFLLGREGERSASVNRVLFNRGIRGVIVGPMPHELKPLILDWDRYACVAVGYSFQQQVMNRVANAHFFGGVTCYGQLMKSGYKRIGYVLERFDDENARYFWQAAARSAPHICGGEVIPPLIMDEPLKRSLFEKWFRCHKPDAVVGNAPNYAANWIEELELDTAYSSLDLHPGQPWSGIRQSWAGIFSGAVDQLAGALARNEFGLPTSPRTTLIEGEWVPGADRPRE